MLELVEFRTIPSPQPSIEGALPGAVYQASLFGGRTLSAFCARSFILAYSPRQR